METSDDSVQKLAVELATFKTEMRADVKSIGTSIDGIYRQLDSVVAMRDSLTKMAAHYEQWRSEKQTMWSRIDDHTAQIVKFKEQNDKEAGIALVVRIIFGVVVTAMLTGLGVLISDHSDIQVLKQQMSIVNQAK